MSGTVSVTLLIEPLGDGRFVVTAPDATESIVTRDELIAVLGGYTPPVLDPMKPVDPT